jgi:hypothetical protein
MNMLPKNSKLILINYKYTKTHNIKIGGVLKIENINFRKTLKSKNRFYTKVGKGEFSKNNLSRTIQEQHIHASLNLVNYHGTSSTKKQRSTQPMSLILLPFT